MAWESVLILILLAWILNCAVNSEAAAKDTGGHVTRPLLCIINTEKQGKVGRSAEQLDRVLHRLIECRTIVVHYKQASPNVVAKLKPTALFLSGQGTPWWEYSDKELQFVYSLIRQKRYPTLGICGGHQLLGKAFNVKVAPIRKLGHAPGYEGCWRERGYAALEIISTDPILKGLPRRISVWENHVEEVKALPNGFVLLVRGANCKIQAMRMRDAPVYGVQFHPEVFERNHSQGKQILLNFLALSGMRPKAT